MGGDMPWDARARERESEQPGRLLRVLAAPAFKTSHLNPYCNLLYVEIQKLGVRVEEFDILRLLPGRFDIFHIHWPEYYISQKNFIKALLGSILLLWECVWSRWLGARVVWTVHNTFSHNRTHPWAERLFWRVFTRLVDGYICLTEQGRRDLQDLHPILRRAPGSVIPHGHYRDAYPHEVDRSSAREKLTLPRSAKVILFFGTIAPYKNVSRLIDVFRRIPDADVILLVAGACPDRNEARRLREMVQEDVRIRLHIGFVPASEIQFYFRAADLIVLPFKEILNSGSAHLALSFDLPLLAPHLGSIPELQSKVGISRVRTYSGELTEKELVGSLRWATSCRGQSVVPLQDLEWSQLAVMTLEFFFSEFQRGTQGYFQNAVLSETRKSHEEVTLKL